MFEPAPTAPEPTFFPVPTPSAGVAASTSETSSISAGVGGGAPNLEELCRANATISSKAAGQTGAQLRVAATVAASRLLAAARGQNVVVDRGATTNQGSPVKVTVDAVKSTR